MAKQLGFYIDQDICVGCYTCQITCKDKNDLQVGQNWRRVTEIADGGFSVEGNVIRHNVRAFYTSISCNHCTDPLCVKNCPTGALYKREKDGLVLHDRDKCIGCRYCAWSCPYGAPQFNPELGKMGKCNACVDLLEKGEQPACVSACPSRALKFGEMDELVRKYGKVQKTKGLPDPSITKPSVVIHPHRSAVR